MSFQHYAVLVIWDYALPDGWELNDEHNNWPTNPVIDGLPYRLVSKRYNDAAYALDIEAFKKTSQMTEQAIDRLEAENGQRQAVIDMAQRDLEESIEAAKEMFLHADHWHTEKTAKGIESALGNILLKLKIATAKLLQTAPNFLEKGS